MSLSSSHWCARVRLSAPAKLLGWIAVMVATPLCVAVASPQASGTTQITLTKHEPEAYHFGRGSRPCRFDPQEQIHEIHGDDEGAYFGSLSREYYSGVAMNIGPIDDHLYHFRFNPEARVQLRPGIYRDTQCTEDPNTATEVGISLSHDLFRIKANYVEPCFEGGFRVLEVEYDGEGLLERFAADFEYHGVGIMGDFEGSIRYNASPEFDYAEPFDLADAVENGRPGRIEVDKTLAASADVDRMDLCTITGSEVEKVDEPDRQATTCDMATDVAVSGNDRRDRVSSIARHAADSSTVSRNSNPYELPGCWETEVEVEQHCVQCIHLLSGSGSLDVWGAAACFDVPVGEPLPSQATMNALCEAAAAEQIEVFDFAKHTGSRGGTCSGSNCEGTEDADDVVPEKSWPDATPAEAANDPTEEVEDPTVIHEPEDEDNGGSIFFGSKPPVAPGSGEDSGSEDLAREEAGVETEAQIQAEVEASPDEPRSFAAKLPSGALPPAWGSKEAIDSEGESEEELPAEEGQTELGAEPGPDDELDFVDELYFAIDLVRREAQQEAARRLAASAPLAPVSEDSAASPPSALAPPTVAVAAATQPRSLSTASTPAAVRSSTPAVLAQSAGKSAAVAQIQPQSELAFDGQALLASISELIERVRGLYTKWAQSWTQDWTRSLSHAWSEVWTDWTS